MDELFDVQDDDERGSSRTEVTTPETRVGYKEEECPVHLVKIRTEGDVPLLYVHTECKTDLYYLQCTDGNSSWTGVVTHRHVKEIATKAKGIPSEYIKYTREALTTSSGDSFIYSTVLSSGTLELSWKRLMKDGVRLYIGSVVMDSHSSTGAVHNIMLEHSVVKISELYSYIEELKLERDRLSVDKEHLVKRLGEIINLKDEIEGDLYGKFKLVLNEKKAKIRRLMESLEYHSSKEGHTSQTTSGRSSEHAKVSNDETDDEMVAEQPEEEEAMPSPKPKSTKRAQEKVLADDWTSTTVSPPTKKRKRGGKNSKGNVSTLQKPKSTTVRRSQRSRSKSSECSTGKSDETIGSQELIEMM